MSQETIEREFSVVAPASLTLVNIRGSVDIRAGDNDVIAVTAVKHLGTGDADRTEIETRQEEDGRVFVATRFHKEDRWSGHREPCKVDYTVRVPHACSVSVKCVSSDTSVRGVEGECTLETVSGALSLSDLTGKIKVTSVSGEIVGERLSGPLEFHTVSGRVRLAESHLPAASGSTVSGDLVLQTLLGEGPYRFESVSGNVRLVLPPGAGCIAEVSSVSGRLKTSLPSAQIQRREGRWHAELQGGGPEVRMHSVSGDLQIVLSEDENKQSVEAKNGNDK